MTYTQHAQARCQQRCISPEVVSTLLIYGRRQRRHGADVCFMDHRGRRKAREFLGRDAYARLERKLDTYLVIADDGSLITAAVRSRRLKFQ